MAVLLPAPLACCRWELERRHMTPPSNFALRFIVEEDCKLVRTLNAGYAEAAPDGGLDASQRDALFDVVDCILLDANGLAQAVRRLSVGTWPISSTE